MADLVRFGVAMEKDLLAAFRPGGHRAAATKIARRRCATWCDASSIATPGSRGKPTVATITLVYDHHVRELTERLTEIQHDHGDYIVSSLHVHLDHHHCMEVIAARGPGAGAQGDGGSAARRAKAC